MKPEIKNSRFINGHKDSLIAKSETNDCFVHALSIAFEVSYDEAHAKAEVSFFREHRKGTRMGHIRSGLKFTRQPNKAFNNKVCLAMVDETLDNGYTWPRKFAKKNKVGTFLVVTRNHALVIKDGIIYDNCGTFCKDTAKIRWSFKIGEMTNGMTFSDKW